MSRFFPVHQNRIGTKFVVSPRLLLPILKEFRDIDDTTIAEAPSAIQKIYYAEKMRQEHIQDLLANGPKDTMRVNENLTLMYHQQLGREIAKYADRYAFFYDTRTGKTPLSLSIIHDDLANNPTHKWLIVCPLILIETAWIEDATKFFPDMRVVNCHASTPAKRIQKIKSDANVYITNTESFVKYSEHFSQVGFTGCIVDESSDMKSPKSKISKVLVEFAQTMKRFYLLSGTPAPNGEWEYYMQMKAIDFYGTPRSYSQFKEHFFINTSYNPQYEKLMLRADRKQELLDWVSSNALYVDKEDALTTPGRTFKEIVFDLPDKLKKQYSKLKNELYLELSDSGKKVLAPTEATKLNKLNQVTSGFIIDTEIAKENKLFKENKQAVFMLDRYRFTKLYDLLHSLGDEQVIIWCNYVKEFETIQADLGDKCRCVYGAVSLEDKTKAIKDFKQGKVQYLIANPASADKGLTLTNSHIAIYFSLNSSYELFKQSTERIYGDISKQPKHCDYYIMIAKGTIDAVLYYDVLQGKGSASYAILNHLKGGNLNASKDI